MAHENETPKGWDMGRGVPVRLVIPVGVLGSVLELL